MVIGLPRRSKRKASAQHAYIHKDCTETVGRLCKMPKTAKAEEHLVGYKKTEKTRKRPKQRSPKMSMHLRSADDCHRSNEAKRRTPTASPSHMARRQHSTDDAELEMLEMLKKQEKYFAIQQLYGWLERQTWARQYYDNTKGITIAISGITEADARSELKKAGFENRIGDCFFETPSNIVVKQHACEIRPGTKIHGPPKSNGIPKRALFSGSLSSPLLLPNGAGLTVGHVIPSAEPTSSGSTVWRNTPADNVVDKANEYDIGVKHHLYNAQSKEIIGETFMMLHNALGCSFTADLCFFQIGTGVTARNQIELSGKTYSLKLFRGLIESAMKVKIVNQHNEVKEGFVGGSGYTSKEHDLYNVLIISGSIQEMVPVSVPGDSGALVLYHNERDNSDTLEVVGIVLGGVTLSDNTTCTYANRLCDVLHTFAMKAALRETLGKPNSSSYDIMIATDFSNESTPLALPLQSARGMDSDVRGRSSTAKRRRT